MDENRQMQLLTDGYHRIACGDDETRLVSKVMSDVSSRRSFSLYEALTEAIAVRLVKLGETKL